MLFVITFRFNLSSYQSVDLSFSRLKLLMLDMTRVHLKKKSQNHLFWTWLTRYCQLADKKSFCYRCFSIWLLKVFPCNYVTLPTNAVFPLVQMTEAHVLDWNVPVLQIHIAQWCWALGPLSFHFLFLKSRRETHTSVKSTKKDSKGS